MTRPLLDLLREEPSTAVVRVLSRRGWVGGVLAASALLLLSSPAKAEPRAEPKATISWLVDRAFATMRDEELKKDRTARLRKLREIVDQVMDWPDMARSCLGPEWRKLDDQTRADFVNVFKDLLAKQYMSEVDKFSGTEKVEVQGLKQDGELSVVSTLLTTASKEKVPITYTLHSTTDGFRVNDFSVEGVSMVNHFRTTFSSYLVNNKFEDLLKQLKRKLGAG